MTKKNELDLVAIARQYAAEDTTHTYTQVADFVPHDWVIAAMGEAVAQAAKPGAVKALLTRVINSTIPRLQQEVQQAQHAGRLASMELASANRQLTRADNRDRELRLRLAQLCIELEEAGHAEASKGLALVIGLGDEANPS